ncbi:MAG: SRPBCC family protein [Bacteroidota bacterium]|jgi:ligand-binding SRPBCC domain-containing protein
MAEIHITTFIAAPADVVFDLYRHIGLHQISLQKYKEEAIRGITTGLIKKGDMVTWRAKHLGKIRFLTVKITELDAPLLFEDTMLEGDFKSLVHRRHFKQIDNGTIVIEEMNYDMPYGIAGKLFDRFYLKNYICGILKERTEVIKTYAEGNKWKALLQR